MSRVSPMAIKGTIEGIEKRIDAADERIRSLEILVKRLVDSMSKPQAQPRKAAKG